VRQALPRHVEKYSGRISDTGAVPAMNNVQLAVHFFFQLAVILVACRAVGLLAARLGQPQVVAEMITGVMLGPSLFGFLAPQWQQALFPWNPSQTTRDTQSYLFPASQLGLALYMFVVGIEFRPEVFSKYARTSVAVSLAGMVAPFTLGVILAACLYGRAPLFTDKVGFWEAALFLGASMCITAFPMLARIIHYKGLAGTRMGTVAIGAGAIDDVSAWCMLALVLASFEKNWNHAVWSIGGAAGLVALGWFVIRPLLQRFHRRFLGPDGSLSEAGLATCMVVLCLAAWYTDRLDLHAVFGSFLAGSWIPRGTFADQVKAKVQPLAVTLLLPLFFTYSGLNTQILSLGSVQLWIVFLAVLLAAIAGKGLACWGAARLSGLSHPEAIGIGVLMNARGLMELIIINIGLQKGVITKELFAILVLMAIVTTLMASPLFDRLEARLPRDAKDI
jgi:Kef-type K+ transport system membrane component KefB